MAFWTVPYRADAVDNTRDANLYWEDINSANADDPQNDFFGQFVDFDVDGTGSASAGTDFNALTTNMSALTDPALFLGEHGPTLDSTISSGISSSDEFDFISSSSRIGATASAASHEINPKELTLNTDDTFAHAAHQPFEYVGRGSMSEADLTRLESITLHSPRKQKSAFSGPPSPSPPNTESRKPKKFVDALQSTIKKATNLRKNKKAAEIRRPASPTQEPQQQLKLPKQRRGRVRNVTQGNLPASPPLQHQEQQGGSFIHGQCEDPFSDGTLVPPNLQYYGQVAPDTPVESPGVKSEPGQGHFQVDPAWQQAQQMQQLQWAGAGGEYVTSHEGGWWNPNTMGQGGHEFAQPPHHPHHQRSATVHVMGNGTHPGMPFDYGAVQDTSGAGLMIHMPQPRGSQSTVVSDLTVNAQTFLPPPPPPPLQTTGPKMPQSERSHRPPKSKSHGARHMSCSPVRKPRGPSASPTPADQSAIPRSRHSSGASVSSVRSASGRLPASMPGTPCSIRKRRSRDVSASGAGGMSVGGDGGGGGIGFVNFTPSDGGVLMTGVAPSGSSKTKARREKEAQERRRRLSEAAIKAVAAAGGDVDKLIEQGFSF